MHTGSQTQAGTRAAIDARADREHTDEHVLRVLLEYRNTGSGELRDQIVARYTNLVESVARRFAGPAEPAEDLAQEGYIGLITAIDLYDPAKNVKFSTYATHFIIGQIKHYLRDRGKIIKEPAWLQELNQKVTRAIESLSQQLSRPPTNLEIARIMDMSEDGVADILMTREVFKVSSIDGNPDSDESSGIVVDIDRRASQDACASVHLPVEDRLVLETAMDKLKELEQKVVTTFYFDGLNQTEIAKRLGISCNYVSHILRNATKKLKKILVTDELRDARSTLAHIRLRSDEALAQRNNEVIVDDLTRLYNRRYFESRLDEEMCRASRSGSPLAVLFVELAGLDEFTRGNGTLKRDEALIGVAKTIKRVLRRIDIVTRYSENVFATILPYTGENIPNVSARVTEVLGEWLDQKEWAVGRFPLVVGVGWAAYPKDAAHSALLTSTAVDRVASELAAVPLARAA